MGRHLHCVDARRRPVDSCDQTAKPPGSAHQDPRFERVSASLSCNLSHDWRLFGFGRVDTISGAGNEDSPLVKRTSGTSVGLGLAYTWMRSERTASD